MITINKKHLFAWISVFIVLYISRDTILFGTNSNEKIVQIGYIVLLMWTVIGFYVYIAKRGKARLDAKLMAILALNLLTMIVNVDFNFKYAYMCVIILLAYVLSKTIEISKFSEVFRSVMDLLVVVSLLGSAVYYWNRSVIEALPTIENISDYSFFNLLLTMIPQDRVYVFYRNYSIFREPGVYMIFLYLAVLLELYDSGKKISVKRIIMYLVAMALTYSTAGYIVTMLALVTFVLSKTKGKYGKLKLAILILCGAIVVYFVVDQDLQDKVFDKLFTENSSLISRVGAFWINLRIAFRDPWHFVLGNGFTYTEENFVSIGYNLYGMQVHNTNTFLKILAVYGVPFWCICAVSLYKVCLKLALDVVSFLGILIATFMAFSNGDLIMNAIVYLLVFYADDRHHMAREN